MAKTATRPRVRVGGSWRFASLDRLRGARFEPTVASDDGQSQLTWRNVETLYYAPRVNLFARHEQTLTGPDGQSARGFALELLRYPAAR